MEMYDENPKKSELVTDHSLLTPSAFNKIMMHARATKCDRANLLAML